jgi:hypothetical protein
MWWNPQTYIMEYGASLAFGGTSLIKHNENTETQYPEPGSYDSTVGSVTSKIISTYDTVSSLVKSTSTTTRTKKPNAVDWKVEEPVTVMYTITNNGTVDGATVYKRQQNGAADGIYELYGYDETGFQTLYESHSPEYSYKYVYSKALPTYYNLDFSVYERFELQNSQWVKTEYSKLISPSGDNGNLNELSTSINIYDKTDKLIGETITYYENCYTYKGEGLGFIAGNSWYQDSEPPVELSYPGGSRDW